jgi:hypothetical protein
MGAVMAVYDGRVFVPESPIKLAKNTKLIISFSTENPYRITAGEKRLRDAAELEYLNANAESLNAEMNDVLQYQLVRHIV